MKRFALKLPTRSPKNIAYLTLLLGLVVYLIGLKWPLLIIVAVSLARFMPMPKIFSSWFSRLFVSIFFIYSFLQIAAVVQFYTYPGGKFTFIAALLALCTAIVIALFGRQVEGRTKVFRVQDMIALLACVVFLLPFAPILRGVDGPQRIGELASVQVVDTIMHQNAILKYVDTQTLHNDYTEGRYYPGGFHIATAFIEHATFGQVKELAWSSRTMLYFMQYMVLGVMLCMTLVYTSFTLLARIRQKNEILDFVSMLTVGVTVGIAATVMHLWLFVDTGFLNYYYVCAASILAACFILHAKIQYDAKASVGENKQQYIWPVFAFLVVSFGAACSWPLLAPAFLLSVLLVLLPISPQIIKKHWRPFVFLCIPIAVMALLHLTTIYMQSIYGTGNGDLILMAGALGNFNTAFLLIGVILVGFMAIKYVHDGVATGVVAVISPFIFLLAGIMAFQYFKLGEARYYAIKVSLILEMFFLACGTAYLVEKVRHAGLNGVMRFVWPFGIVLFIVFATIGTLPNPMVEVRSLFRKQSGAGIPPFMEQDVDTITRLLSEDKLRNFNMTILHYDSAADRYFAHIQIASWAQIVSKYGESAGKTQADRQCLEAQYYIWTQLADTPGSKDKLQEIVRSCAQQAAKQNRHYYIVTDKESAPNIRATFGPTVEVVY